MKEKIANEKKKIFNKFKFIKASPKNLYLALLVLVIMISGIMFFSKAIFTSNIEKDNAITIVSGTLKYTLNSSQLTENKVTIFKESSKTITITITNINDFDTTYELYYLNEDNDLPLSNLIEIGYLSDTIDPVKGTIEKETSKIIRISVKNASDSDITISFGVQGGLINRTLTLTDGISLDKSVAATARVDNIYFASLDEAITYVTSKEPETVYLLRNTTEHSSTSSTQNINLDLGSNTLTGTINNSGSLNILNGTITYDQSVPLTNVSSANMSVTNSSLSSNSSATIDNSGTFTFNSGSLKNTADDAIYNNGGTVNINGGTINSYGCIIFNLTGEINISGGEMESTNATAIYQRNGGSLKITGGTIQTDSSGNVIYIVKGNGEFSGDFKIIQLASNYNAIANEGGTTITIDGGNFSSECGMFQTTGIINAKNATISVNEQAVVWNRGGTVTFDNVTSTYVTNGIDVDAGTLNLKNSTFTKTTDTSYYDITNSSTIVWDNTILDTVGSAINNSGTIKFNSGTLTSTSENYYTIVNTNKIDVYDGFTINGSHIFNNDGTITIYGGTFNSDVFAENDGGILNVNGGNINSTSYSIYNTSGTATISGGNINSQSYCVYNKGSSAITKITGNANLISEGSRAISNLSSGTIIIDGGSIKIASGYGAYNSSSNLTISGGTINASSYGVYNTGSSAITEISGNPIIESAGTRAIYNTSSGTMTIKGGTITATNGYGVYNSNSNFTISGGSINASSYALYNTGSSAVMEVKETAVIETSGSRCAYNNSSATLNINGGTLKTTTGYGIYNNANLNITAGLITTSSSSYHAIYNTSTGVVTISGGTVSNTSGNSSTYAIYNNSGTVSYTGGTTTPGNYGI